MIIVMKKRADQQELENVINWIESVGYKAHVSKGVERTIIGAVGDERGKVMLKPQKHGRGLKRSCPSWSLTSLQAGRPKRGTP